LLRLVIDTINRLDKEAEDAVKTVETIPQDVIDAVDIYGSLP
jgi:hypothetical protein